MAGNQQNFKAARALNRRNVVAGAVAATGALFVVNDPASAQRCPAPPRAKGPAIWLDMDQQELDEAYDQSVYAFNLANLNARGAESNEAALARIGASQRIAYGTAEIETARLYHTTRPGAPILIFIHGGSWLSGSVRVTDAAMAEAFVKAGAHFVGIQFSGAETRGGDLFVLVDQCRRAVAWVYRNAASFSGDPDRIYLCGHSSGAHLGGCVLLTDWSAQGLPANILKSAILGSGMYDLKAVRLSKRSQIVKFTDEMEQALSPQRHLDKIDIPLVLTYGTAETPEFQRQTRDFAAALTSAGKSVRLLVGTGYSHFETQETLRNPYGFMGRAALEMMNLAI